MFISSILSFHFDELREAHQLTLKSILTNGKFSIG